MSGSADIFGNGNWSCTEGNWYTATTTTADLLSDIEDGPVDPYVMIYTGAQSLPVADDGLPWDFSATLSSRLAYIFDGGTIKSVYLRMGLGIDDIFGLSYVHEWSTTTGGVVTGQDVSINLNFLGDYSSWNNTFEAPLFVSDALWTLGISYDRAAATALVTVTHPDPDSPLASVTTTMTASGLTGTATPASYPGFAATFGRYWPETSPYYGIKVDTPMALMSQPTLTYTDPASGSACTTVTPVSWAPAPETGTVFQISPEYGSAADFVVLVETDCDVGCGDVCGGAAPGSLDCRQLSIETCGPAPC